MDTTVLLHAGGFVAMSMAGVGALRFFLSGAEAVKRVPVALERGADALEKQAAAAEQAANLAESLYEIREGQEQIRISMSALAQRQEEMRADLLEEIHQTACATVPPKGMGL